MKKSIFALIFSVAFIIPTFAANYCSCTGFLDGGLLKVSYYSSGDCADSEAIDYSSGSGSYYKDGKVYLLSGADPDVCFF